MLQQVGPHLAVDCHQRAHGFRLDLVPLPRGRRRDERLQAELVRVQKQADERHLIVRFVPDIAQDDNARLAVDTVDVVGPHGLNAGAMNDGNGKTGDHAREDRSSAAGHPRIVSFGIHPPGRYAWEDPAVKLELQRRYSSSVETSPSSSP